MPESPAYRVLARKYRPQRFSELIGQDAMVQTLANAIRRDRIAHAFLLTGVRGVGKTSTARLIAKALNCVGADGQGGPTIDPCGACEFCVSIAEGRNLDVIEMDAASHTGVDDMRSVIEISRNTGFGGRHQIFIIDEVHMLSKNAFNALLKTLEEPPEGVKFILATTEVQKVPVTVLSRCQRFDLRRIPAEKLARHFAAVAGAEGVAAEGEALAMIARAAEGSARDGLSILDQAIAHADAGGEGVTAARVREMLGLSDRGAVRALLGMLLAGDAGGALAALAEQHALGVEPAALFRSLLDAVHGVTLRKAAAPGAGGDDPAQSAEERAALADWASRLSYPLLHRLWQMLLKGLDEVQSTGMPLEAAEMALLRLIHASELPDPAELARRLRDGAPIAPQAALSASPPPSVAEGQPPLLGAPTSFPALVRALGEKSAHLAQQLHDYAGLVRYAPPELVINPQRPLDGNLVAALRKVAELPWRVEISAEAAEPSLLEQERSAARAAREAILESPVVAAAIAAFPDAELLERRSI